MVDTALNIFFGLVGLIGFAFAIWQWNQSEAAKRIMERSLEAIITDAEHYERLEGGSPASALFGSLGRQCSALLSQPRKVGRFFVRYYPGEDSSRWLTACGDFVAEPGEIERKKHRIVVAGKATADGVSQFIYGPYETLPFTGSYIVEFNLLLERATTARVNDPIVRLDVYGSNHSLAERRLFLSDVANGYQWHSLSFRYKDLQEKLEYRVALLQAGLEARLYDVIVRRVSN